MKSRWRLILDSTAHGYYNMAVDYMLLKSSQKRNFLPTLRLYSWQPAAITIGYFQNITDETHYDLCLRDKIPVIRRITGGGAVFHQSELTYSAILPNNNPLVDCQILESYKNICMPLMETLRSYSLNTAFAGINDIVVNNQKVSGNAQTRRFKGVLQHGTLLLDLDAEKMFSYLKVPLKKHAELKNIATRVTSLHTLLGKDVLADKFQKNFTKNLINCWKKIYNIDFYEKPLTHEEQAEVKTIEKEIFKNPNWNMHRKLL
jgi:lipoate-protein ligase A